ncbi:hypothetical protein [Mucilaginibacter gynuensis]|uniref:hypothetical protein n=1 Tax=Mucilaginibacter gynuensis TaxID=1302236 RepID=UPI0031ED31EC
MNSINIFKIKNRPYNLLALVALILLVSSFLPLKDSFDVNLHDAYFIISTTSFCYTLAVVLLLIWTIYFIVNQRTLSNKLTWAHTTSTLLPVIAFLILLCLKTMLPDTPVDRSFSLEESAQLFSVMDLITKTALITLIIFGIGQVIGVVNILGGLIKSLRVKQS